MCKRLQSTGALSDLGEFERADAYAEDALDMRLWKDARQRPYDYDGSLTARPWHDQLEGHPFETAARILEREHKAILGEYLQVTTARPEALQDQHEGKSLGGQWQQLLVYRHCDLMPLTCTACEAAFATQTGLPTGNTGCKFSVMKPGVFALPHHGPTNKRLRCHLGVVVPEPFGLLPQANASDRRMSAEDRNHTVGLRCGGVSRGWHEGKVWCFDDSFEHSVWHGGTKERVVLIVDLAHPELWSPPNLALKGGNKKGRRKRKGRKQHNEL